MRFLVITEFGDTGALAQRILAEGHDCKVWVTDKKYEEVLNSIVHRVQSPAAAVAYKPDVVVCLETGLVPKANIFRSRGFPIVGGDKLHDDLETRRFDFLRWAESFGLPVPQTARFKTTEEAKHFLGEQQKRYITKYDDDDTYTTYLGKNNDDVMAFLDSTKPEKGFVLQEYIEPLLETSVEVWFSGGEPIMPPNGTIEQKRFLAGDMGPNSGSESSLVWPYNSLKDKLVRLLFTPGLLAEIKRLRYSGPLDLAVIIAKKDSRPWIVEATPRAGINAIYGLLEIMESPLSELLLAIATSRRYDMKLKDECGFALTVSIPPYPYEIEDFAVKGQRIEIEKKDLNRIWFNEVSYDQKKGITAVGLCGVLLTIGTADKEAKKAVEESIAIADRIKTTEKQYRIDAGEQVKHLATLKELGYLSEG